MIWRILRKDLLAFWPLILLMSLLQIAATVIVSVPDVVRRAGLRELTVPVAMGQGISVLVVVALLLIVLVVGADSPSRANADWRTRALSPWKMLAAKLLFAIIAIQLVMFGCDLAQGLAGHLPLGDCLIAATRHGASVFIQYGVLAVAISAVAGRRVWVVFWALGALAVKLLLWAFYIFPGTTIAPGWPAFPYAPALRWALGQPGFMAAVWTVSAAVFVLALWLVYDRRWLSRGRLLVAGGLVLPLLLCFSAAPYWWTAVTQAVSPLPELSDAAVKIAFLPHQTPPQGEVNEWAPNLQFPFTYQAQRPQIAGGLAQIRVRYQDTGEIRRLQAYPSILRDVRGEWRVLMGLGSVEMPPLDRPAVVTFDLRMLAVEGRAVQLRIDGPLTQIAGLGVCKAVNYDHPELLAPKAARIQCLSPHRLPLTSTPMGPRGMPALDTPLFYPRADPNAMKVFNAAYHRMNHCCIYQREGSAEAPTVRITVWTPVARLHRVVTTPALKLGEYQVRIPPEMAAELRRMRERAAPQPPAKAPSTPPPSPPVNGK